jgi:hypothetical protein
MVPSCIKIGKEQLNVLAYADDIVLIGRNEIEIRQLFCRNGKHFQKARTIDKLGKNKIYDSGKKKHFKTKKIGHLKIKNYKFKRVENFKYLGVILHKDNSHQIHLQERIKNTNKTYCMLQYFFKNKNL